MNTFLTPSSIAAELRPDLDPEDACEIYTGTDPRPLVDIQAAVAGTVHTIRCQDGLNRFRRKLQGPACVQDLRLVVV